MRELQRRPKSFLCLLHSERRALPHGLPLPFLQALLLSCRLPPFCRRCAGVVGPRAGSCPGRACAQRARGPGPGLSTTPQQQKTRNLRIWHSVRTPMYRVPLAHTDVKRAAPKPGSFCGILSHALIGPAPRRRIAHFNKSPTVKNQGTATETRILATRHPSE